MSATQQHYSSSMSMSPPPPSDLGSYARTMHQHTKRQMEAISSPPRSSSSNGSTDSHHNNQGSPTGLPNGYSNLKRPERDRV
ncbi:hypothetical protein N0V88_001228 [Collariella sp. IMI 366227]|nr:hypothetical protein N0V88_001228 [Collariella sp. IMI 366227]